MSHDYCTYYWSLHFFFFFVLTSGRPLPVTTFFVFRSHFAAQIVIREFSAPLQQRCLSLSKGFPLQRETAKICYCCSQPFYSSFVALLEVILQCCSSAARFVRVSTKYPKIDGNNEKLSIIVLFWNWASNHSNQQQKRWRCFANQ